MLVFCTSKSTETMADFEFDISFSCDNADEITSLCLSVEQAKYISLSIGISFGGFQGVFTTNDASAYPVKEYQRLAENLRSKLEFTNGSIRRTEYHVIFRSGPTSFKIPLVYGEILLKELARKRATFLDPQDLPYLDLRPRKIVFQTLGDRLFMTFYTKFDGSHLIKNSICLDNFRSSDVSGLEAILSGKEYSIQFDGSDGHGTTYYSCGEYFYIGNPPSFGTDPRQLRFPLETCRQFLRDLIVHLAPKQPVV